jgi:hypothetical protein
MFFWKVHEDPSLITTPLLFPTDWTVPGRLLLCQTLFLDSPCFFFFGGGHSAIKAAYKNKSLRTF